MKYHILSLVVVALVVVGAGMSADTAHAMNKAELIEAMASHAGLSKADSKKALDGFSNGYERRAKALKKGDRLSRTGAENSNPETEVQADEKARGMSPEQGEELAEVLRDTPNGDKVMRILKKRLPGIIE